STLQRPSLAHAFYHTLPLLQIGLIVARRAGTEAGEGEGRIERKACLNRRLRFIQLAEMREGRGEVEMRRRKILVGLDAPAKPRDCFLVAAKLQLCDACERHPEI